MSSNVPEMPPDLFRELVAGMTRLSDEGSGLRYILASGDGIPSEYLKACRLSRTRWLIEHTLVTRPWGRQRGFSQEIRRFTTTVPEHWEQDRKA